MDSSSEPGSPLTIDPQPAPPPDPSPARLAAPAPIGPALVAKPWRTWQCVLFRYALCHWLLYSLPTPFFHLLGDVSSGLDALGLAAESPPASWLGKCMATLALIEPGWQRFTTWMSTHGLTPWEVIHQPTGSGDTAHDITKLLVVIVAALLLTIAWSLLRTKPTSYPRLGRWLHLVVRFDVAFQILGYGLSKLYGGQFGEMSLDRLTQEIGDTAPMTMVGTFMKASKAYEIFGGLGEVLGPLLLFHHRTVLLGAFVTIGVMANVVALNWLCGVPVKLYSAHLLLFSTGLLAPFGERLWAVFVTNTPSDPIDLRVVRSPWARRTLFALGCAWVVGHLVSNHFEYAAMQEKYAPPPKSTLYGVWIVETMLLDGKEVPVTDATKWKFLAIDRGTLAWTRAANGQQHYFDFGWDPATGIAKVKARGAKDASPQEWTVEVGTKMVPCDVTWLLRNEERGRKVACERRTLTLKGQLGDRQLEVHTYEKLFPLLKGFRLRQELPEFW